MVWILKTLSIFRLTLVCKRKNNKVLFHIKRYYAIENLCLLRIFARLKKTYIGIFFIRLFKKLFFHFQCEPVSGLGFRRGSYKCVCKIGYYFPNTTSENRFFNGTDVEDEAAKLEEVNLLLLIKRKKAIGRTLWNF